MPLYDYQCSACGHEMEVLQKMSDAPLTHCPACDTESLKKKVTAAAFRLSGSGWYETDFKSDNKKNLADNQQDGKDKSATDKAEKKDSKKVPESAKSATTQSAATAPD
ncbi:MAG: transcriptional regulator [Thiothrix nivea]|nr:MAG: transcriptional regulator [Thiothrix nivea]